MQSDKIMKKTAVRKKRTAQQELAREYRFDYKKSKPNRFASSMSSGAVAVVLEPDVAAVFKTSETVNTLLRSVISATQPVARSKRANKRLQPAAEKRGG